MNKKSVKESNAMKKTMTKKQYKEMMKGRRSLIGLHQNLGTRCFKTSKDYKRHRKHDFYSYVY